MVAVLKYLLYSLKPLSRTADIWDIKDIIQAVLIFGGWLGGSGFTMTANHDLAVWILAGIPALLFFVAGIKLQRKLTQRISLVFGENSPYKKVTEQHEHTHDSSKLVPRTVHYCLGLGLSGNKNAEVEVMLVNSEPLIPQIPATLTPLEWQPSGIITVYPTGRIMDFIKVVSYPSANDKTGDWNEIEVHVKQGTLRIPCGRYVFTLLVKVRDGSACEQRCVVEVDDQNELQFYAIR